MRSPARTAANEDVDQPAQIPSMPAELHAHLPYLLNRLSNRWNIDINRDLSEHGINNTVLRTLSVLYIYKTLTVNEIASYAIVEQSNASRTIDTMVTAGLVKRQIAANDLRRREIGLTVKGEALLRQLWPIMVRNHGKLIEDIPEDDLKVCLNTLLAMIRNIGESPV
ncbi:MarR family winged helix-turn-helix transcriptional regulator [Tianweitania populi]|uniref:Transcriptional regulator n=1 Tax=Tianweitania populi TaxID=1607949 RepID=A0A8J3DXF0_9HYPH|nr:MarR family winged helix-turn-helix transcriptional regulator [Tianweitania populi]GHD20515.1 transcriptional regulator [Tianweitania populi]